MADIAPKSPADFIGMRREPEELQRFVSQGRGIQQVLQAVEDTLIDAGYDDFVVATEHGTWH